MKKIVVLLLAILLMLGGCKKDNEVEPVKETNTIDYTFKYEGKSYELGGTFDSIDYDEPLDYTEIASCAFEGLDKTYKYEHFELTTYPIDGVDKLSIIYFTDDEVKTNEGVGIADSFEDMTKAYGTDYVNEENMYSYKDGKKSINFIVENDFITSVEYDYEV